MKIHQANINLRKHVNPPSKTNQRGWRSGLLLPLSDYSPIRRQVMSLPQGRSDAGERDVCPAPEGVQQADSSSGRFWAVFGRYERFLVKMGAAPVFVVTVLLPVPISHVRPKIALIH